MSLPICQTVEQVEQTFARLGVVGHFTAAEREAFATTPVVTGGSRIFGFPTPADNSQLTLFGIKKAVGADPAHQPSFFEHEWYAGEGFMATPCPPGWHFLHMDVLPDSVERPADYAGSLSGTGLELPSAVEVVLMLFLHFVGSGEQLLLRKHTWCSDLASLDRQVTVGAFGRNGVFLSGHPSRYSSRGLGICAKIRMFT